MAYLDHYLKAEDPGAAVGALGDLGVRHVLGPVQGREDSETTDPETGESVIVPGAGNPAFHYFAVRTKDPGLLDALKARGFTTTTQAIARALCGVWA